MTNQAFVFIKPHAVGNDRVGEYLRRLFQEHGISVDFRREMSGAEIAASGIVDAHYALNAAVGTCEDPSRLEVDREARKKFQAEFGMSWDAAVASGRVASGLVMCHRLGIDGETLNRRWAECPAVKLAGGLYVARFPERDVFVMNGFYPSLREILTAPDARVLTMTVSFDPARLSWKRFRTEIVGATNPAEAHPGSVRGWCYAHREALGLEVGYRENVIHASASAFEAVVEKWIWLGAKGLETDPLAAALRSAGISPDRWIAWRDRNPQVVMGERRGPLVDLLEERDALETAEYLIAWQAARISTEGPESKPG